MTNVSQGMNENQSVISSTCPVMTLYRLLL